MLHITIFVIDKNTAIHLSNIGSKCCALVSKKYKRVNNLVCIDGPTIKISFSEGPELFFEDPVNIMRRRTRRAQHRMIWKIVHRRRLLLVGYNTFHMTKS